MATITKALLRRIAANLAVRPLEQGEFRPIAKMGGYYISLEPTLDERKSMFSLYINGSVCHIYYAPDRTIDADND